MQFKLKIKINFDLLLDRVTKWKRLRGGLYLLQNIPRTEYGNPFKDEMLNSLNQSHKTCLIST